MSLPLSVEQEMLWLSSRLYDDAEFPMIRVYDIEGEFDRDLWERALRTVSCRHEALGLFVRDSDQGPLLEMCAEPAMLPAARVTARHETQFLRFATGMLVRDSAGWRSGSSGALRARVLSRGSTEHLLLLSFNHMILDRRSIDLFCEELFRAIEGEPLPPVSARRFTDYARAQHRRMQGERADRALAYWRDVYAFLSPQVRLTIPGPAAPAAGQGEVSTQLDGVLLAQVRDRAAASGSSLFAVVLAAFGRALFARCHDEAIAVHVPLEGRGSADKLTMGMFVTLLPLVLRRSSGDFDQAHKQLRHDLLLAMRYRDAPAEPMFALSLARADEVGKPWRHNVMANHLPHRLGRAGAQLSKGGLRSRPRQLAVPITREHLVNLKVYESPEAADVVLDYDRALVDGDAAAGILWDTIAVTADPRSQRPWVEVALRQSRRDPAPPTVPANDQLRLLQARLGTDRDDIGFWAAGGTLALARELRELCGATTLAAFRDALPLREVARRLAADDPAAGVTP